MSYFYSPDKSERKNLILSRLKKASTAKIILDLPNKLIKAKYYN